MNILQSWFNLDFKMKKKVLVSLIRPYIYFQTLTLGGLQPYFSHQVLSDPSMTKFLVLLTFDMLLEIYTDLNPICYGVYSILLAIQLWTSTFQVYGDLHLKNKLIDLLLRPQNYLRTLTLFVIGTEPYLSKLCFHILSL